VCARECNQLHTPWPNNPAALQHLDATGAGQQRVREHRLPRHAHDRPRRLVLPAALLALALVAALRTRSGSPSALEHARALACQPLARTRSTRSWPRNHLPARLRKSMARVSSPRVRAGQRGAGDEGLGARLTTLLQPRTLAQQ